LRELEDALAQIRKRGTALAERAASIERADARAKKLNRLLEEALAVAGRKLDALEERRELETRFERGADSVSEAEKKRLQQEILRMLEAEESFLETALGLFRSERAAELTGLLESFYGDLYELERKVHNLEKRRALTERLVRLAEEERRIAEALLPLAREELARARAEEAEARLRYGLASPADPEIASALEALERTPQAREPIGPDGFEAAAERLFDARMRVKGMETWIGELEGRLTRAGIDADKGHHQDEIAAIVAKADGVRREIERLRGHDEKSLAQLDEEDRPKTESEKARYLLGEIGYTRQLRRSVLLRAALFSALSLVVIPIVALYLVRAARIVGGRIVARVRAEGDENGALEREQRAHTLVQVFKAAWTAVVWVVAAIYMLKQLSVDVTPILASAGVAGLALAFGAQTLIRDFFAGFFMLLENQYKIGDVVALGDVAGVVERITLRLTVLRDLEGKVHFVPNGTVQRVTNMTKGWARAVIEVGVAYKEDIDRVIETLREIGRELERDPVFGPKLVDKTEVPGLERFEESALTVRMLLKTRPGEQWAVAREARRRIKAAFDARGIEIPFPQRVIYHVNAPARER
jgi:small conductance mechanosensitive channel